MLPKIGEKGVAIPYQSFARQLMNRKVSDNNISKLKLIKQFLQDQQNDGKFWRAQTQLKRKTDLSSGQNNGAKILKTLRLMNQKQNQSKLRKYRRQSLTAQNKTSQAQKPKLEKQKQKQKSVFFVPDRFKINEKFQGTGRHKKNILIKDIISGSMRINHQVSQINTHRIL